MSRICSFFKREALTGFQMSFVAKIIRQIWAKLSLKLHREPATAQIAPQVQMQARSGLRAWQFAKTFALHKDVHPLEFTIEPEICTIGRFPTCQIIIARKTVSRLHAKIQRDEDARYILYDIDSANGTFVNGQRIREPYLLEDEDELGFGTSEPLLRFEDPEATLPFIVPRLRYDPQKMMFLLDQQPLKLTPAQLRLLRHLYQHAHDICTRDSCAEVLWGREYDPVLDTQALDRAVSSLRRQLRWIAPDADMMIITHRGLGYELVLMS
jgi:DNA-binding response OmpR family regulator